MCEKKKFIIFVDGFVWVIGFFFIVGVVFDLGFGVWGFRKFEVFCGGLCELFVICWLFFEL